jgi:polyisoprenoid-binding protein YceI
VKHMNRRGWLGLMLIATWALVATPLDAKLARTGDAAVVAHATAAAGMKIDAATGDLRVSEGADAITLTVPLATLRTGIGLRDRHMRDKYLEVDKYPNAEVVVKRSALKFPEDGKESSGDAAAAMTLHGQTKPVTLRYSARLTGDSLGVRGSTTINILDFGIKQPGYMGVNVNPVVNIDVRFQATDK